MNKPVALRKGSQTHANLKTAFALEAQANRRYLYFAAKADVEGYSQVASLFRATADGETGHAHGHLEYLEACGDPVTDLPFGATRDNLLSAIASEHLESGEMYVTMSKAAREEGYLEIAAWFETLARAERAHANQFQRALDNLED
ncbi:MAG: rubrerythrin family protein [Sulfuricella sp.]|nr:rubrerythrin family protein [Sulfuricella sp.]